MEKKEKLVEHFLAFFEGVIAPSISQPLLSLREQEHCYVFTNVRKSKWKVWSNKPTLRSRSTSFLLAVNLPYSMIWLSSFLLFFRVVRSRTLTLSIVWSWWRTNGQSPLSTWPFRTAPTKNGPSPIYWRSCRSKPTHWWAQFSRWVCGWTEEVWKRLFNRPDQPSTNFRTFFFFTCIGDNESECLNTHGQWGDIWGTTRLIPFFPKGPSFQGRAEAAWPCPSAEHQVSHWISLGLSQKWCGLLLDLGCRWNLFLPKMARE